MNKITVKVKLNIFNKRLAILPKHSPRPRKQICRMTRGQLGQWPFLNNDVLKSVNSHMPAHYL